MEGRSRPRVPTYSRRLMKPANCDSRMALNNPVQARSRRTNIYRRICHNDDVCTGKWSRVPCWWLQEITRQRPKILAVATTAKEISSTPPCLQLQAKNGCNVSNHMGHQETLVPSFA